MLELIGLLIIIGIVFYFVNLIPMASPFPEIIRAVACIIAVVIVLQFFGVDLIPLSLR